MQILIFLEAMSNEINESVELINQQKHNFEEETENDSETTTQVYPLRWWIAVFFGVQITVIRMIMSSFGVVNNIYKAYFKISYYAIDWFTLIQEVGKMVSSILLAFLSFNKITKFRKLFVMMVSTTIITCISIIITFAYPHLYALIYLGMLVIGFSLLTGSAISVALATNWFPENQIGTAMSFQSQGMVVGAFLAFLIPSQLATPPPKKFSHRQNGNMTTQFGLDAAAAFKMQFSNWHFETYWKFSLLYGCALFVCVIVLIFSLLFVSDYPKKPPTIAQALVRAQNTQSQYQNILRNFEKFIKSSKSLLFDKVFFLAVLVCYIVFSLKELQRLLMGQIFRDVFNAANYGSRVNAMSGYVLMVYEIGNFFGHLVSSLLLDYLKKHKLILYVALMFSACTSIGLAVGQYYNNVVLIFVFIALFGFAVACCHIPIYDMVLEHTYPANPSFVILLFKFQGEIVIIIISQISRFILDFISGTAVFIFMISLVIMCIVLTTFINPEYRRKEANTDQSSSEEQQLLNVSESIEETDESVTAD